ncbi:MAG TPA: SDR family NAD(P)-dependent oxidoreductase, partial [Bryobacteraceae bacterium]|nr:SDR family NAD(P)-dependent oxidoreductase [Bryobacteraceae bacterium]
MGDLSGRTALVTGASRGIGAAIAAALAREGSAVAVNYREREAEASEVARRVVAVGARALTVQADVTRAAEVQRLIRAVEADLGPIDILVNNAGIARVQAIDQVTEQDWDEVLAANLKSCFLVTQAVVPGMRARRWGRIVNLSSVAAQTGGMVGPHYAASKAGLHGLTHSYASALAPEGITVNAIAPALIDTEMVPDALRARKDLIPVGRLGTAEEVAE